MPEISEISLWCAVAVAFVAFLYTTCIGLLPLWRCRAYKNDDDAPSDGCKVSIVVYTHADADELGDFLRAIAGQDYQNYEVIAVCDADMEMAESIAEEMQGIVPHLHVTFIPSGSHNVSRRKLANTIGIKAATGDVVLTTVSAARPSSDRWLSLMMTPFNAPGGEYIDVALGVSRIDFTQLHGASKWYKQFDATLTDAVWTGYAAGHKPYRGDGNNLAFRRKAFFDNRGYARTINLHNGDDDLFVNEISTGSNTRLVLSDDALMRMCWGDASNRVWRLRKDRYEFTQRWLPKAPFVNAGFTSFAQWVVAAASVAVFTMAALSITGLQWTLIVPAIIALVILLAFWGIEIFLYRSVAARLGSVRLWWGVIPFWLWRPIANALFRCENRNTRRKNFTWVRGK